MLKDFKNASPTILEPDRLGLFISILFFSICKGLKILFMFCLHKSKHLTSEDYCTNKICILLRLDIVDDINVNTEMVLERFMSSLLS